MKTNAKTSAFLQALNIPTEVPAKALDTSTPQPSESMTGGTQSIGVPKLKSARNGKKHVGAYFHEIDDAEVLEQFALLRARLRLDNSGLMRLMICETFRKLEAKRAFGDA